MKLVSFRHGGRDGFGVISGDGIIDLTAAFFFEARYADLREVLAAGAIGELASAASEGTADLGLTDVSFLLPIPRPRRIVCVGQNYPPSGGWHDARPRSEWPNVFGRLAESFVPHGEAILRPSASVELDYEGELGIVIGREGRHIPEADALAYVGGYTCVNEGSVRDWQTRGSQNFPGKNFRHSGSMGPWIVTADEIPDPATLTITTRVNGEVRQQGGTGSMIFPVPSIIAYVSEFMRLEPGDIISTGSPGDTAADMDPPGWLAPGDRLEVEVSGIGTLENPVEAE
jgi:5-carboxymethyl-2-hydroxymuconate isomerase